jgi:hypothetical protein
MKEFLDSVDTVHLNLGKLNLSTVGRSFVLSYGDRQLMTYFPSSPKSINEFYGCYELAYGNCVLSGLGMGLLPTMLLEKREVEQVTVYEKNHEVIRLNKLLGLSDKINVIHKDIHDVRSVKCDTLLLDHYEHEPDDEIVESVASISSNNDAELVWFWRLENILVKEGDLLCSKKVKNAYDFFKESSRIANLPNVSGEEITQFCFMFHSYDKTEIK